MPRPLPLTLSDRVVDPAETPRFEVETSNGMIRIRGHLSTGSRGWVLRGEAACRRSVVTLQITAVEVDQPRVPDLEHHEYEAQIAVKAPGRYGLRVSHAFLLRREGGFGLPHPVHEASLSVP